MTRAQRQHASEERRLLALRRAAVRFAQLEDELYGAEDRTTVSVAPVVEAQRELEATAHRYANALTTGGRRKLARRAR